MMKISEAGEKMELVRLLFLWLFYIPFSSSL